MPSTVYRGAFDSATASAIPIIWEPVFEYKSQKPRGVADLCWNISDRVQGKGNKYRINILEPLGTPGGSYQGAGALAGTAGQMGAGHANDYFSGSGLLQTWDYAGNGTIPSNLYAGAAAPRTCEMVMRLHAHGVTVDPDVNEMAVSDMVEAYTPLLIEDLYQGMERQLCMWAGSAVFSQFVGGATNFSSSTTFAQGLAKLMLNGGDKLRMGKGLVKAVLPLAQLDEIVTDTNVMNAQIRGTKEGVLVTGNVPEVFGVPIFLSDSLYAPTYAVGFLMYKKALAWGRKYAAKIETDRQDLINKVLVYSTWGVCAPHSYATLAGTGAGELLVQYRINNT